MMEHTDAYKNFEANLKPLVRLFKMLKADIRRFSGSLEKSASRHIKPTAVNVKGLVRSASKLTERADSLKQTQRLIYDWIPVMLVTFLVAYFEDGLREPDRTDPKLRAKLRQQWAGRLKGGPQKWVEFLQRIGPKSYKGDCLFVTQDLWHVRNLIVHTQGRADHYYVKKYPNPPMKVGDRIYPDIPSLKKWIEALMEFVESTEQFFLRYATDKKAAHSHD